jgi:hypothetical protein
MKKIKEMTDKHIINAISYWEKILVNKPDFEYYSGDSFYAEQAVDQENRYNEMLAEQISEYIIKLKKEAKKRKLI